MALKRRLFKLVAYFRRGHASYFGFAISLANFLGIMTLLGTLPLAVAAIAAYVIVCIVVGRWDFRRGLAPVETELAARANPYARVVTAALYHLARGENEKAEAILREWLEGYAREGYEP